VLGGRAFDSNSRVHAARVNLHLFGVVEGEDDMIRMGMVRDVTQRFVKEYLAALLDVIRAANVDEKGQPIDESRRLLSIGPRSFLAEPGRSGAAVLRLLKHPGCWKLAAWVARNAGRDLLHLPLRLLPTALLPRYQPLPAALGRYARFAERRLARLRWTYLGFSLIYQLELTRAQIPLQRIGLAIEHLVSLLALCHHAAVQDESQQDVALLQAQVLKDKVDSIKLLGGLREIARLRRAVATVGDRIQQERISLFDGLDAEPFAHPWEKE
jgi:hypothetical protein